MTSRQSIWFRLGHAYERARLAAPAREADAPRAGGAPPARETAGSPGVAWPTADELFSAAAWLVLDRVVGTRAGRRRPGPIGLIKAGAAGAAAALLVDLLRPLLHGDASLPVLDRRTVDRVLAGLGQGLVYGALVEPSVPGPPLLKGVLYGSVEFATDQVGGLSALLGPHAPQGRLPVVGEILEGLDVHDRAYLEHVVFGIALALLYESSPESNGTRPSEVDGE